MTNSIIITDTAGVLDYEAKTPIENFSHVVRVNSGWDVGFSQHVGNRTDTLVLNPWFVHVPEKRNAIQTKPSYPEIGKILIAPSSGVEYSMPDNISELFPNGDVDGLQRDGGYVGKNRRNSAEYLQNIYGKIFSSHRI